MTDLTDSTKFAVEVAEALGWPVAVGGRMINHTPSPRINAYDDGEVFSVSGIRNDDGEWHPDTNANDDCEVLVAVRGWEREKRLLFELGLRKIWENRCLGTMRHFRFLSTLYYPGDYARAVLAVVEKEKT